MMDELGSCCESCEFGGEGISTGPISKLDSGLIKIALYHEGF